MKLLHLADLHIGKTVNEFSMIDDQEYILDQITELIKKKNINAVVMAGDIYDRAIPSEEAVRVFNGFIEKLVEMKTPAFIISGNHDSDERLNFGSAIFRKSGVYIVSKYNGELFKHSLEDEHGTVNFFLMPFIKASRVRQLFPEEKIETYDDAVRVVIDHADIDAEERNVLAAHQFVAGGDRDPVTGGSENAAVLHVGTVERISSERFAAFDYTALGHIHSPQKVGQDNIRYSGSPLKYSLSEINDEKSVPVITLGEKGNLEIELVTLKPRRDIRHIKGRMEQLLDKDNITDPDDYIYVTLTDEELITDAITIIRQYYPNTMKIDYDNSHTRSSEVIDLQNITRDRSFEELVDDFYRMMYGCDISGEEMKLLQQVAKETGVIK